MMYSTTAMIAMLLDDDKPHHVSSFCALEICIYMDLFLTEVFKQGFVSLIISIW